jgi:arsenate reductase-like glutaredoxin family protein
MIIDDNNMGFVPSLGTSYQLNSIAKEVIKFIKEGKTKEEIVQIISEKYGKNWREVYIDIEDFFQKLKLYGFIQ